MASITPNNRSMNGINQIEASSISFPDGTVINTNDFASEADVSANQAAIAANTSSLSTLSSTVATNQAAIAANASSLSSVQSQVGINQAAITANGFSVVTNQVNIAANASSLNSLSTTVATNQAAITANASSLNSLSTTVATNQAAIATKQDTISVTAPIEKSGSTISVAYDTSPSSIGGSGNLITSNGVFNALQSKQDTLTTGEGIALSSNEISLDLSTLNSTVHIPQRVQINNDSTSQLIVKTQTTNGADAAITIRGARSASTNSRQAQLRFENYDINLAGHNDLGEIAGVVSNATTNVGGLTFSHFSDGSTRRVAATMNNNGKWNFGTGFQDTYKLKVAGDANITSDLTVDGNLFLEGGSSRIDYTTPGSLIWYGANSANSSKHIWKFGWGVASPVSKVEFRNLSNDNNCYIYAAAYSNLSDDRIKTNEQPIENATATLNKLRPLLYDEYGNIECSGETRRNSGLIAQEVYYNAPELKPMVSLNTDADGNEITPSPIDTDPTLLQDTDYGALNWGDTPVSLNYIYLIPYLIKSNQELAARIEALENNR